MVVLHEYERGIVARLFEHRLAEELVDLPIDGPVPRIVDRPGEHHVTERPEPLIGEAVVVAVFLGLGQPHPAKRVARIVGWNTYVVVPIDGPAIGIAAAVRHPDAAGGAQDRFERRHHAAGRRHALDASTAVAMLIGLAVADEDEAPLGKLRLNELVQCALGPHDGCSSAHSALGASPKNGWLRKRLRELSHRQRGKTAGPWASRRYEVAHCRLCKARAVIWRNATRCQAAVVTRQAARPRGAYPRPSGTYAALRVSTIATLRELDGHAPWPGAPPRKPSQRNRLRHLT